MTYIQYRGENVSNTFLYNYFSKDTILDLIITNVGILASKYFIPYLDNYIEGIRLISKKVVWRTTTYIEKELELLIPFSQDRYTYHFYEPIYTIFTDQLLDLLI